MELLAEQKLLFRHKGTLAHKRKQLEEADRRALADAQFDNPKAELPPNPKIAKVTKEIEAVERRTASLDDAIDRAEMQLVEVIEANREAWAEAISPEVDQAYTEYEAQITALEAARRQVSHKLSIYQWLRNFSTAHPKDASYKPSFGSWVPLKQLNGEPYTFANVVEALLKDAQRPPERGENAGIPWGDTAYRAARAARTPS
jgi:hypothetical protein